LAPPVNGNNGWVADPSPVPCERPGRANTGLSCPRRGTGGSTHIGSSVQATSTAGDAPLQPGLKSDGKHQACAAFLIEALLRSQRCRFAERQVLHDVVDPGGTSCRGGSPSGWPPVSAPSASPLADSSELAIWGASAGCIAIAASTPKRRYAPVGPRPAGFNDLGCDIGLRGAKKIINQINVSTLNVH
jgi:hypothetical protein